MTPATKLRLMKQLIIAVCLLITSGIAAQSTTIKVYGNCGMCKDRIEQAALSVIGVSSATWSSETEQLTVQHASLFVESELHQKMTSIGHDTGQERADDSVYANLHSCCKYERPSNDNQTSSTTTTSPTVTLDITNLGHEDHDHTGEVAGMIFEETSGGIMQPLVGATVTWYDNTGGTFTDQDGHWSLASKEGDQRIVVSYVGYEADTIDMTDQQLVAITLRSNHVLEAVEIKYRKRSTEISFIDPIKSQRITQKELCKAACCNLSESFETTPAVDVATADAVTGTRKIQMLGLAGPNIQIMRENMPYIRGLAALVGMEYTPGPWIESIQLNLGTGSVVNGPESITGQINVETKKPLESEKFYLNLFGNLAGRLEANVNTTQAVTDKWSTATLLHAKSLQQENDRNNDDFLDVPQSTDLILTHRWRYRGDNGLMGQIGVKGLYKNQTGGQVSDIEQSSAWRSEYDANRVDVWTKVGKVFKDRPYASVGFQLSGTYHDQRAHYGRGTAFNRTFDGIHRNLYANLIYQTIIGNTDHTIKTGSSFVLDDISETIGLATFDRNEVMPGAFVEYQYTGSDKVSIVAGLRGDYHNLFGAFVTPRLHVKYSPTDRQAFRIALGRGQRTQSIFAENIGLFASNRTIGIQPSNESHPYGLVPDIGWNIGLNYTVEGEIASMPVLWGVDYYYTVFTSQVVADYETSATVRFYALDGQSRSHSVQTQVDLTPAKGLDLRLAYRYNDPRTQYDSGLLLNPLVAQHRAFANVAYETESGWMLDLTANWIGRKRLPNTSRSPSDYQLADYSPDYRLLNGQITKRFGETLDIYVGGENILNFRQENPIVAVDDVSSPYFDASMIWGPILGGNAYVGIRYRIL